MLKKTLDFVLGTAKSLNDVVIENITNNSQDVTKNTLFLAYPGEKTDGRKYITQAIEKNACAVAYEPSIDFSLPATTIPCVPIQNVKVVQSTIAARFYDFPSTKVSVIGVTGTNGKTSITHFIAQAVEHCGVIGTIGYGFLSRLTKSINTTPDGLLLQKMFFDMVNEGAKMIAMEVSSHALAQHRVNDVQLHTAVFTNLTQDHLDYHHTMENYRDAKELLFQQPGLKNAVINIDDDAGRYFSEKYRDKLTIITYSLRDKNADICVLHSASAQHGFDVTVKTPWGNDDFHLPLIGTFNIYNALAVLGVLGILQVPFKEIIQRMSQLKTVNGRAQLFHADNKPTVVVDYAHTPDALEKILQHVRAHCDGKLWCVFGCGGERDKTKRSKMGAIADHESDYVIITNDNPRSEQPETIAQDIFQGVKNSHKVTIELNRAKAITHAIQSAEKNDWVVVAGKGHETEQMMGDHVLHHDDAECVRKQCNYRN